MALKVTTWNLEHAARLVGENPSAEIRERRQRVRDTLEAINPDVLCLQEGPRGEAAIDRFCTEVLDRQWLPVLLQVPGEPLGQHDLEYQQKGSQWVWFLVKAAMVPRARLQAPSVWQAFTGGRDWQVHFWGVERQAPHSHYRHPQVLILDLDGQHQLELIGVHLKSKINQLPLEQDAEGNLIGPHVREATEARIKLATEARDVRRYIDAKFEQLPDPALVVLGDCNDGPGHDLFEEAYLFFDLIGNLQGEVLVAERFFNHALFDYPGHLRWSARYDDDLLALKARDNPLLLDHILVSQPLCRGTLTLVVNAHAGQVEHEAFERANAGAKSRTQTSDHRPVSLRLEPA